MEGSLLNAALPGTQTQHFISGSSMPQPILLHYLALSSFPTALSFLEIAGPFPISLGSFEYLNYHLTTARDYDVTVFIEICSL